MSNDETGKINSPATLACISILVFWSVGPIFIKLLTGHIDFWTQNLLRYLAACLFWLPFLLYAVKKRQIEKHVWRCAIIPAVANIVMQCFWAGAFYYLDPAFMILLTKSSIIWIAGFSLIFFADERGLVRSRRFWVGMVLCVIGVGGVMFLQEDFGTKKTLTGIVLASTAAFTWGVYTVSAKIAFKNVDSRSGFSVMSIYTVAGLFILAILFGKTRDCLSMGAWPWAIVVISGVLCISFTHVLYYAAMKRIGATIPSLVLLATPFTVLAVSSVVFSESLRPGQWVFGMVLLAGCGLTIWAQQHLKRV